MTENVWNPRTKNMKRYLIKLMMPAEEEVVAATLQEAHNEATKLAGKDEDGTPIGIVSSITLIGDVSTEPLDFEG